MEHIRNSFDNFKQYSVIDSGTKDLDDNPKSWEQAKATPDAEKWLKGDGDEINSLQEMGVFKWVKKSDVPNGHKLLQANYCAAKVSYTKCGLKQEGDDVGECRINHAS
ncbi:hypothetical protein BJ165DRAFT_1409880 [Panaeolus papilionaceus]|nr:hypothetical protein BJ165DRAFT_1409880 [Panaeolus papilionaceus]